MLHPAEHFQQLLGQHGVAAKEILGIVVLVRLFADGGLRRLVHEQVSPRGQAVLGAGITGSAFLRHAGTARYGVILAKFAVHEMEEAGIIPAEIPVRIVHIAVVIAIFFDNALIAAVTDGLRTVVSRIAYQRQ